MTHLLAHDRSSHKRQTGRGIDFPTDPAGQNKSDSFGAESNEGGRDKCIWKDLDHCQPRSATAHAPPKRGHEQNRKVAKSKADVLRVLPRSGDIGGRACEDR